VSSLWTFFFGCFYFLYKGWFKAAAVAFVISCITGGLAWLVIPFFAKRFVDEIEAW
jgi:hypothetical protein